MGAGVLTQVVDICLDTSNGTGTGNLTLAGAVSDQYFAIADVFADGATFNYHVENVEAAVGKPEWEAGAGSLSSGALVRTTVTHNSRVSGDPDAPDVTKIDFTAGLKHVRVEFTLAKFIEQAIARAA